NIWNNIEVHVSDFQQIQKLPTQLKCVFARIKCDPKRFTDYELKFVSDFNKIKQLNLTKCYMITDNGLQHLKALTSLQQLNLRACAKITDKGLQHLKELTSLQQLNLHDKITDNGLQHLTALISLVHLD